MIAEPEIYNGRDVSYGGREGPYDGNNIGSSGRQVIIPGPGVYRGQDGLPGGYARPYDGRNGPNGGHRLIYLMDPMYIGMNSVGEEMGLMQNDIPRWDVMDPIE